MTPLPQPDTHHKALTINLDPTIFGSFAEIGAGQEVARWFLLVGAASGTVAKTVSAYDKEVSDDLYGAGSRYVSRQRLESMLEREWSQLLAQLAPARGGTTCFFAFADTVAARNYAGTNESHGWMGLRFQDRPGGEPSEIVLHVNMRDPSAELQQAALGVLGVNLIYAVFRQRQSATELLDGLAGGLESGRLEVDLVDLHGPAFAGWDRSSVLVQLVHKGLAEAVTFPAEERLLPATELLHKKAVVLEPASFETVEPAQGRILAASVRTLAEETGSAPIGLFALPLAPVFEDESPIGVPEILRRVGALRELGAGALVFRRRELYAMTALVNRFAVPAVRFAVGLPTLVRVLDEVHYRTLEGQLLEGVARLFAQNVRLYAHAVEAAILEGQVGLHDRRGWEWTATDGWVSANQLRPPPPLSHLYAYLVASGFICPIAPPGR